MENKSTVETMYERQIEFNLLMHSLENLTVDEVIKEASTEGRKLRVWDVLHFLLNDVQYITRILEVNEDTGELKVWATNGESFWIHPDDVNVKITFIYKPWNEGSDYYDRNRES